PLRQAQEDIAKVVFVFVTLSGAREASGVEVPTELDVPSALRLRAFGASLSVTSIVGASTTALRAFAHGDIAKHGRYFKPSSRRLFEAIDQTSKPSQSV